jgi:hypothetical protein
VSVINGLLADVLFVGFVVVLEPLTALLEIAALWPAPRRGQLAGEARLGTPEVGFSSNIVICPGARQIPLENPAGNPIELFTPAAAP